MSSTSKMPWMVSCSSVHQVLDWQDAMTFFTLGMTLGCLGLCIRFDRAFCTTGSKGSSALFLLSMCLAQSRFDM